MGYRPPFTRNRPLPGGRVAVAKAQQERQEVEGRTGGAARRVSFSQTLQVSVLFPIGVVTLRREKKYPFDPAQEEHTPFKNTLDPVRRAFQSFESKLSGGTEQYWRSPPQEVPAA